MKKLLFVSILIYSSFNAFAQKEEGKTKPTDKGHFIVDGSVGFSINNSKLGQDAYVAKSSSFNFSINPKAAYFIADRLALGLETSFGYFHGQYTIYDGTKYTNNISSILVGPYVKYYLVNGIFGQASVGFGTSSKNENSGYESKDDYFNYQLGLGYAIFLNQHISLEPIISYQYNKTTSHQSSSKTIDNGFTLGAGFTIYL